VQLGDTTAISSDLTVKVTDATFLKGQAALGLTAIWGELGVKHSWSELSSTYFAVRYGHMGTIARCKVKRGSTVIEGKMLLSVNFRDWQTALAAAVVPSLLNILISKCALVCAATKHCQSSFDLLLWMQWCRIILSSRTSDH
jgi:hypothetical protein